MSAEPQTVEPEPRAEPQTFVLHGFSPEYKVRLRLSCLEINPCFEQCDEYTTILRRVTECNEVAQSYLEQLTQRGQLSEGKYIQYMNWLYNRHKNSEQYAQSTYWCRKTPTFIRVHTSCAVDLQNTVFIDKRIASSTGGTLTI